MRTVGELAHHRLPIAHRQQRQVAHIQAKVLQAVAAAGSVGHVEIAGVIAHRHAAGGLALGSAQRGHYRRAAGCGGSTFQGAKVGALLLKGSRGRDSLFAAGHGREDEGCQEHKGHSWFHDVWFIPQRSGAQG